MCDRPEEVSLRCASDERSACIEAFGTPALRFCHLNLCTSPSQVPSLSFYPSSSSSLLLRATRCCVARQVRRLSLSLSFSLYRVRYGNIRVICSQTPCVINSAIRAETEADERDYLQNRRRIARALNGNNLMGDSEYQSKALLKINSFKYKLLLKDVNN